MTTGLSQECIEWLAKLCDWGTKVDKDRKPRKPNNPRGDFFANPPMMTTTTVSVKMVCGLMKRLTGAGERVVIEKLKLNVTHGLEGKADVSWWGYANEMYVENKSLSEAIHKAVQQNHVFHMLLDKDSQ